jgi:hypothetical protein
MTATGPPLSSRPRRTRRRLPGVARWVIRIAIVAAVFAIGVAVGQALEDRPRARDPVTNISTIRPWTHTRP